MVNLKDNSGRSLYFSNRPEYYRRLKISNSLKSYYKKKVQEVVKPQRKRTQKVLNSSYSVSLRAIGFNKSEDDLDDILKEFLNSNPDLLKIPFSDEGFEEEIISDNEDRNLDRKRITIEFNVRGNTTYTEY
jgi:hypothetical protein